MTATARRFLVRTGQHALGNRLVSRLTLRGAPSGLRILAYHDVPDPSVFEMQVSWLVDNLTPVTPGEVVAALSQGGPLPPRAVLLTFDDGAPGAIRTGHLLADAGIRAVAFVCPSVVGTDQPHWWQLLDACRSAGLVRPGEDGRFARSRLKGIADADRRAEVDALRRRWLDYYGRSMRVSQPSLTDLRQWTARGHEIGNHTWDHPLLDQCEPQEQRHQVRRAHEWLEAAGLTPRLFAYPNGNVASSAVNELRELGYAAAFLFDHRRAHARTDVLRVSRMRLDSDASLTRARSVASGAHSAVFHLVGGR